MNLYEIIATINNVPTKVTCHANSVLEANQIFKSQYDRITGTPRKIG